MTQPFASIRIPVGVRIGRARFWFRMPPIRLRFSGVDAANGCATMEARSSRLFQPAMMALKAAILPLVVVAWLTRSTVEVTIGEDATC
jgi:hypothetical protein